MHRNCNSRALITIKMPLGRWMLGVRIFRGTAACVNHVSTHEHNNRLRRRRLKSARRSGKPAIIVNDYMQSESRLTVR